MRESMLCIDVMWYLQTYITKTKMPVDAELRFNLNSGVVLLTIATRLLVEHCPRPSTVPNSSLT